MPDTCGPGLMVESLSARYGMKTIFRGVEFSLSPGDSLVIAGANGAGKSTLLRILAGLVRPSRGQVSLRTPDGNSAVVGVQEGAADEMALYTGLSSPDIQLYGELTALENLRFYARLRGLPAAREFVLASLERVGLRERADDRVGSFSTGMKQRLRLLFAIQHQPFLLLLDEPGSNLDSVGRDFTAAIANDQRRHGVLVLATNDPEELQLCSQILQLKS